MDLELTGKRAIVTGGSHGIGREAGARALAAEGCDVVVAARTRGPLEDAAAEISEQSGRKVVAVTVDTTQKESVEALIKESADVLGGIDILVNSAASTSGAGPIAFPLLADTTDEDFWEDVNTKVVGYLRTARAAAPYMVDQGWGRIINVSGLGARETKSIVRTVRNVSVAAMTKNLADQLGKYGVNAVVVHPGATRTDTNEAGFIERAREAGMGVDELDRQRATHISIGRTVMAAEVANVIAFIASPKSVAICGDAVAAGGGVVGAVYY